MTCRIRKSTASGYGICVAIHAQLSLAEEIMTTLVAGANSRTIGWGIAILAGIVAMIVFAIIEMAFSWAMRGTPPWTPLAIFGTVTLHAIVPSAAVGGGPRTAAAGAALLVALGALSGVILAILVHRVGTATAAIVGVVFGIAMYAIDMYGVARIFPSLVGLRDWMSALAYVIQGALTAGLYKVMTRDVDEAIPEGTGHDLRDLRNVRLV
jgi:hypothetical protein